MHTARREEGELSVERFGELWCDVADTRCSATRSRSPTATALGGRTSRTSSGRPATCTRTRTASCSRCRCTRSTRRRGAASCRSYLDLLRGRRIEAAARSWARSSASTSPIPASGTAASTSSNAASKRRSIAAAEAVGTVVVTYRVIQWSTGQRRHGRAALHRSAIPISSSSGCGCTRPTRPGKDAGELGGLAPNGVLATNDVDALLALDADCVSYTATADLRPGEAIDRHGAHPRVGQERRVELGRVDDLPAARRPAGCASRSKPRAATGNVSCFTSGIDPGWANDLLPFVLTGTCEYIDEAARDGGRQLQRPTSSRPCCSTRWASARRSTRSRCSCSPACCTFAWGGVVKVLAAGLGVEIDELREVHERQPAPADIDLGFGVVEAGHHRGVALRGAGRSSTASRASSSST